MAPVACMVTFDGLLSYVTTDLTPSCGYIFFKVSVSVFCGNPKSRISSNNSYISVKLFFTVVIKFIEIACFQA